MINNKKLDRRKPSVTSFHGKQQDLWRLSLTLYALLNQINIVDIFLYFKSSNIFY